MRIRPTSFSAFGVGVNWEFTKSDKDIAQEVMDFLADRRVLTIGRARPETEAAACLASAAECRTRLSEYMNQLKKPGSDLRIWLRAMRQAFVDFIEAGGPDGSRFEAESYDTFHEALAHLRNQVQQQADEVSGRYKLVGLTLPAQEGWSGSP